MCRTSRNTWVPPLPDCLRESRDLESPPWSPSASIMPGNSESCSCWSRKSPRQSYRTPVREEETLKVLSCLGFSSNLFCSYLGEIYLHHIIHNHIIHHAIHHTHKYTCRINSTFSPYQSLCLYQLILIRNIMNIPNVMVPSFQSVCFIYLKTDLYKRI